MPSIWPKAAVFAAGVAVAALTISGCTAADPAPEPTADGGDAAPEMLGPVSLGTIASGAFVLPFVADELGYFEEAGIEVDITEVGGGMAAVLASQELDYGVFAGSAIFVPRMQGSDVKMLASFSDGALMKLVTTEGIESFDDLRGGTVAFAGDDSVSTIYFREALRQNGIDPETDVTVRTILSPGDQFTALVAGQVNAALLSPPSDVVAEAQGANVLLDIDDLEDFPFPRVALLSSEAFASENPEATARVIRGLTLTIENWDARSDEILEIIARLQSSEVDDRVRLAHQVIGDALTTDAAVSEAEAQTVLDSLLRVGIDNPNDLTAKDFYTNEFVERARGE